MRKGKGGGIPWFVFTDASLTRLVTSDGPKGNVGFPVKDDEIAHFVAMLHKVRKKITKEDVTVIEMALRDKPKKKEPK